MTDTPSNRNEITEMAGLDYSYTELLGLALYGDVTPADLTNGHNFNMRELDKAFGDARAKGQTALEYLEAMGVISEATANALKARVDNADTSLNAMGASGQNNATNFKAKVDNADTSLNVLGASGQASAAALKKKIDDTATGLTKKASTEDVYSKQQSDERYRMKLSGSTAIWLGDSITEGYLSGGTNYRQYINTEFGFTEKFFAKGGTGWLAGGPDGGDDFANQAQKAINSTSFDHADVSSIFILGGVNDFASNSQQAATIVSRVTATINALLAAFPNAKIYVGNYLGGQRSKGYTLAGGTYKYVVTSIASGCRQVQSPRLISFPCFKWLAWEKAFYNTDGLHPNQDGHKELARLLSNVINGAPVEPMSSLLEYDIITDTDDKRNTFLRNYLQRTPNSDSMLISMEVSHVVADDELSGTNKDNLTCTLGIFPEWFKAFPGLFKLLWSESDFNGWGNRGYYVALTTDGASGTSTPKVIFTGKHSAGGIAVGSLLKVNVNFEVPIIGYLNA
jgi:lysophospholipase L1-like esterase